MKNVLTDVVDLKRGEAALQKPAQYHIVQDNTTSMPGSPNVAARSLMVGSSDDCEGDQKGLSPDTTRSGVADDTSNRGKDEENALATCCKKEQALSSSTKDDNTEDEEGKMSHQPEKHSKWLWLHAAYHCLVTIVGTGILGFPRATAYLVSFLFG